MLTRTDRQSDDYMLPPIGEHNNINILFKLLYLVMVSDLYQTVRTIQVSKDYSETVFTSCYQETLRVMGLKKVPVKHMLSMAFPWFQ